MEAAVAALAGGAPTGPGTAAVPKLETTTAQPQSPGQAPDPKPGEPKPGETPAAAAPAKPGEEPAAPKQSARQLAIWAKRERQLQEQERAVKADRQAVEATKAELEKMKGELDARMKSLGETEGQRQARRAAYQRDPRLVLQDAGLTLEQLAEAVMRDGQPDPVQLARSVDERLAEQRREFDEKLEARDRADREREEQREQARREAASREVREAEAEVLAGIAATAKASPEKYELMEIFGKDAQKLAFRAMEQHFKETGEDLPYSEACDRVESFLTKRMAKSKRFKAEPGEKKPETPPPAAAAEPSKTLGNAGQPPTPPARARAKTEDERMRDAEAALRNVKY